MKKQLTLATVWAVPVLFLFAGCKPTATTSPATPPAPPVAVPAVPSATFAPPASPRAIYNFNPGWKFVFGDQPGADQPGFDDSTWTNVSLPHTWNDTDSYRAYISHSGGDQTETFGVGWYRKHLK